MIFIARLLFKGQTIDEKAVVQNGFSGLPFRKAISQGYLNPWHDLKQSAFR
jgi:hypothetical protein